MSADPSQFGNVERAYELLGVRHSASTRVIKRAYRLMAKRWHPDLYPAGTPKQAEASRMMERINDAYGTIRDAPLRYAPQPTERTSRPGINIPVTPEREHSAAIDQLGFWVRFACGSLLGMLISAGIALRTNLFDGVIPTTLVAFVGILVVSVVVLEQHGAETNSGTRFLALTDNFCKQAISQACAVWSPFRGILSAIRILQQSSSTGGPPFDLADTGTTVGAPSFAQFAKGGYDAADGIGFPSSSHSIAKTDLSPTFIDLYQSRLTLRTPRSVGQPICVVGAVDTEAGPAPQHARAKRFAPRECGWKHGVSGYSAGEKRCAAKTTKTHLTPTGLLMESHCAQNPHAGPTSEIASYVKHSVHTRLRLYLSEDNS